MNAIKDCDGLFMRTILKDLSPNTQQMVDNHRYIHAGTIDEANEILNTIEGEGVTKITLEELKDGAITTENFVNCACATMTRRSKQVQLNSRGRGITIKRNVVFSSDMLKRAEFLERLQLTDVESVIVIFEKGLSRDKVWTLGVIDLHHHNFKFYNFYSDEFESQALNCIKAVCNYLGTVTQYSEGWEGERGCYYFPKLDEEADSGLICAHLAYFIVFDVPLYVDIENLPKHQSNWTSWLLDEYLPI